MKTTTILTATLAASTHRHSITGEVAPLAVLPRVWGGYADGEVVYLDGAPLYYFDDATGEAGLYREAVAMDAGDNEVRRRAAPESLNGIAAPVLPRGASPALTTVGDGLVAWVRVAR